MEPYEVTSHSPGFIKRFFQRKNLIVGWYCFWRASLLSVSISFIVIGLFYLSLIPIGHFFLKGTGGMEFARRLNAIESIYKYFIIGIAIVVIPTLSYNWVGKKALKKYYGLTTKRFSCLKVYPFAALLQTVSFGLFLPFVIHIIGYTVKIRRCPMADNIG
jgi:hypothetical protein